VFIECDSRLVSIGSILESGAAKQGRFPWGKVVKTLINTWLVRTELGISVDWEHGTGMDQIVAAPATHPATQVGHTAIYVIVERRINITATVVCI
jgi:hypothetical protein